MKKRVIGISALAIAMLALAGCEAPPPASSYQRPIEQTGESTHTLEYDPPRAATCIVRNVEQFRTALKAQIVRSRDPSDITIEIRGARPAAIVRLRASGPGSSAFIRTPLDSAAEPRQELIPVILHGC